MNLCPILGWRENRKTSILRPKNPLLSLFFSLKPTQWTLPRPSKRAVSANAVLGIIWSLTTSWTRTGDWWQTFWGDFWMDFRVDFQDNFGVFYRKQRVFFWHQRNSGGFLPTISMAIVHSYVSLPGKNPFFSRHSPPFSARLRDDPDEWVCDECHTEARRFLASRSGSHGTGRIWEISKSLGNTVKISLNILSTNDLNPSFGVEHGPSCHKRRWPAAWRIWNSATRHHGWAFHRVSENRVPQIQWHFHIFPLI